MSVIVHTDNDCYGVCAPKHTEDPPDPDKWGNRRVTIECIVCGARGNVMLGAHGGLDPTRGFALAENLDLETIGRRLRTEDDKD